MASALVMLTGQFLFETFHTGDPSRLGAQVISGIGFLGAGTIIITSKQVKGLTTAAGLWASACLGLAVGAGFMPELSHAEFFAFSIFVYVKAGYPSSQKCKANQFLQNLSP